jgi:hypothetical protein
MTEFFTSSQTNYISQFIMANTTPECNLGAGELVYARENGIYLGEAIVTFGGTWDSRDSAKSDSIWWEPIIITRHQTTIFRHAILYMRWNGKSER